MVVAEWVVHHQTSDAIPLMGGTFDKTRLDSSPIPVRKVFLVDSLLEEVGGCWGGLVSAYYWVLRDQPAGI